MKKWILFGVPVLNFCPPRPEKRYVRENGSIFSSQGQSVQVSWPEPNGKIPGDDSVQLAQVALIYRPQAFSGKQIIEQFSIIFRDFLQDPGEQNVINKM